MSEGFESIVERAVKDEEFRKLLITDPQKGMEGYTLTKEEQKMLSGLTEETFDQFVGGLGPRTTQGKWIHGAG